MAVTSGRRGPQPPQAGGNFWQTRYADEWRHGVDERLQEAAQLHSQAAVTFERVNGRLDEHDRQLKEQAQRVAELERADRAQVAQTIQRAESSPDRLRANIAIVISGVSVALYLFSIVAAHWH